MVVTIFRVVIICLAPCSNLSILLLSLWVEVLFQFLMCRGHLSLVGESAFEYR